MAQSIDKRPPPTGPRRPPRPGQGRWDEGLALAWILGERTPSDALLAVITERIRAAARHLRLSRADLGRIFGRHEVFEAETEPLPEEPGTRALIVETHHLIQGKVGKGAFKLVYPEDLLGKGAPFQPAPNGAVEILAPDRAAGWAAADQAEEIIRHAMRELMIGESLSMSLKCQATGAPFAGSEGLLLCAKRTFDPVSRRFFIEPMLKGESGDAAADKENIEWMTNAAAEVLTRAGRIAHDRIVHAAETNSTLTARLDLQLPTNVVEGHLRTLLLTDPDIVIGDDDMTARLREILARSDYRPTACALATAAARMQMEHSILLPASRERLRALLAAFPSRGMPTPVQYREVMDLFFGSGKTQQTEEALLHHREPLLRALSVALTTRCLDECGDPEVLTLYLRTLLDNQRIMLEKTLVRHLPPGASLPLDWFERAALLSRHQEQRLWALMPGLETSRTEVADRFLSIVNILVEAVARDPAQTSDPYRTGRRELLEIAIRAVTSTGEAIPPVDRIVFFTLPLTYQCATPKLGVVTRKPVAVCGSELRPEAMAVGAVKTVEILLRQSALKPDPVRGLTVAIEGLGNAGKNVARLMMAKGAILTGVSDSRGALLKPAGITAPELAAILAHKDAGHRLDTFPPPVPQPGSAEAQVRFEPDSGRLKQTDVDVLVLAAIPASIRADNVHEVRARIVCELAGAAVTGDAKPILQKRRVQVIPDNLASSGGLLVSLCEMLQNSAGQTWHRRLEEERLGVRIERSCEATLALADRHEVDLPTASDILALQRMHALATYRKHLEAQSHLLARHIRAIQPDDGVLVVLDDDEDGVASAAILSGLFAQLHPSAETRVTWLNDSFRTGAILDWVRSRARSKTPVRHVFVLDRAFPLRPADQEVLAGVAERCRVTFVNNHLLPPHFLTPVDRSNRTRPRGSPRTPSDLGILLISPQSLRSTIPAVHFPTAMIAKEVAHVLLADAQALTRIDWQAAVGSFLDAPPDMVDEWLLFYSQFSPDRTLEAARAIRTVTRTGGYLSAIQALRGVTQPDRLETNAAWGQFLAEYKTLDERIQVLVEKIVIENRRRPYTAHFFTDEEVVSPLPQTSDRPAELKLYHWISEVLTQRGNLAEKPVIVGQLVRSAGDSPLLGVRVRSPRGVDLMAAGLPSWFETGGLPNTAVARIPCDPEAGPRRQFQGLVEDLWMRTIGPLGAASGWQAGGGHSGA